MSTNSRNKWDIAGLVLGIIVTIAGLVVIASPEHGAAAMYGDGFSRFGGDFYTYIYSEVGAINRSIKSIGIVLATYFGMLFMIAGLLTTIHYGKKCSAAKIDAAASILPSVPIMKNSAENTEEDNTAENTKESQGK
ncbi:MAG: hypothetical protein IJS31_04580 [Oscillospiraceae bacterium]|nr:hypothetical protein [Oscillospiraceae bacterium]